MNNPRSDAERLSADAAARRRALDAGSFLVEAPAGAGKTELLTQRYLKLLAAVDEPEEIIAITFTLKAAAEMRNRILASFDAADGAEPAELHRRTTWELARAALAAGETRGWQLRQHPGRLRIMTIDSLAAALARQMPFLSRFGAQPQVDDDPARHYEEAARRTLALIAEPGPHAEVVAAALDHLDNDAGRLRHLLAEMLARRDQWLRQAVGGSAAAQAEQGLRALVIRDLAGAARCIGAARQESLMAPARQAAAHVGDEDSIAVLRAWTQPLAGVPEELPGWRGLCDLVLTGKGEFRKRLDKSIGLLPGKDGEAAKKALQAWIDELAAVPAAAATLARLRELPEPRYDEAEWRTVEALAALLKLGAAQLLAVFLEAGQVDFVEVAQRALHSLGDAEAPSDLALRLDYRISHLLVDEFQDTSPAQVELLQRLTAGWSDGDGRTLFVVGDPMQSIYRFRKADVGLFLRAAEVGIGRLGLTRLQLARNNRSCEAVVDWINGAFARLFPGQDDVGRGAIRYRRFVATRQPLPGAGVEVHPLVVAAGTPMERSNLLEARRIAEIIDEEWREDPRRRIAVLVRARNHLDGLAAEIRRHRPQWRFQAVEIEALAARQSVQDLLSLTRALFHRADRVNWLAILRAPWCGLCLADLHALAGDDHDRTIWQLMHDEPRLARLSEDGRLRLGHLRGVVEEAFAHQGRQRPRRWVEGVWLKLGGPRCVDAVAGGADVGAFLDLVDGLDAAGRFSIDTLEDDMARLYAAPDAEADGRLQFMTVHKAKGLEFDTVILPGLHRRGRGDDPPLLLWEEVVLDEGLAEHLVAAPLNRRGGEKLGPTPYDYLRRLEQERAGNEDARVLYVAATRAVRKLHLVGIASPNARGELAPPSSTALGMLWPSLAGAFSSAATSPAPPDRGADESRFVPRLLRLVIPGAPAWLSPTSMFSANLAIAHDDEGDKVDEGDPLDVDVGTLVHRYLELIARSGPDEWPVGRLSSARGAMRRWFEQRGHAPAAVEKGVGRAASALEATLASAEGRWVLAPRASAASELALAGIVAAQRIATGIVDRTFVEAGVRWIIDYKTARVAGDAGALLAHAGRYRPQIERYAALFRDEGLTIRAGILFAAVGRLAVYPEPF